ncbi:MAG: DUF1826 domain-containing protein [Marinomonas sp.]
MSTMTSTLERPTETLERKAVMGEDANTLTAIYDQDVNIAVWQREHSDELNLAIDEFMEQHPKAAATLAVSPTTTHDEMYKAFKQSPAVTTLADDIALIVDMFCCLFEQKRAGLRLTVIDGAMCPRFHVDLIPCRLVTTYRGIATEWLKNDAIDRTKLGLGNQGKSDEESGLFKQKSDINQLTEGDVALLKGENWQETKGGGLVHRSPLIIDDTKRLLLTLDFIDF